MFFVVYLVEPKKYAVIPCHWIHDDNDEIWDKFINNGLNSSQKYLCYWASEIDSAEYRGSPNDFYEPNFEAPRSSVFPCNEATYVCRIVKFRGKIKTDSSVL